MAQHRRNSGLLLPVDYLGLQFKVDSVGRTNKQTVLEVSSRYESRMPSEWCCDRRDFICDEVVPLSVRDFPVNDTSCFLRISRQRFRCKNCGNRLFENLENIDKEFRVTSRLKNAIFEAAARSTFVDTALRYRVPEKTVSRIFRSCGQAQLAGYQPAFSRLVGLDLTMFGDSRVVCVNHLEKVQYSDAEIRAHERAFAKESSSRSSLAALLPSAMKTVAIPLEVQPSTNERNLQALLEGIGGCRDVKAVCHDDSPMWFDVVRRSFPCADSVLDKFHVIRIAKRGLSNAFRNTAKANIRYKSEIYGALRHIITSNINEKVSERLDEFWRRYPALIEISQIYHSFVDIYQQRTFSAASHALENWLNDIAQWSKLAYVSFRHLRSMIDGHKEAFLSYFKYRITNGAVEEKHRRYKYTNLSGRGYEFMIFRMKVLLCFGRVPSIPQWTEYTGLYGKQSRNFQDFLMRTASHQGQSGVGLIPTPIDEEI